mgnify:CR=1 FL=1
MRHWNLSWKLQGSAIGDMRPHSPLNPTGRPTGHDQGGNNTRKTRSLNDWTSDGHGEIPSHMRDTGCEVSPSCFTCPLSKCRWDGTWDWKSEYVAVTGNPVPILDRHGKIS